MDWIYVEKKYRELQFEMDKAFDKWSEKLTNDETYRAYVIAKQRFSAYCVDTLAELMEENKDVLERLKMVKCPNCGSTAQIKLVWEDRDSYSTTKIKEYICGCGCHFEVIFEAKIINILTEEN